MKIRKPRKDPVAAERFYEDEAQQARRVKDYCSKCGCTPCGGPIMDANGIAQDKKNGPARQHRAKVHDGCGGKIKMNEKHDALYCVKCDRWLETPCSDSGCSLCSGRPARPSKAAS